jgi:hypothetical protein
MVGISEGWYINEIVLVSPAVFQLITDEEDVETRLTVIKQLKLKEVNFQNVITLVMKRWYEVPKDSCGNITARIHINACDFIEVLDRSNIELKNGRC